MREERWLLAGLAAAIFFLGTIVGFEAGYKAGRGPDVSTRWFDTLDLSAQRDSLVADAARSAGLKASLLIALSHAENNSGDSAAVNPSSGAIGLMQVMPGWQHAFEAECGCGSLYERRRNACVGVHIFKWYLDSLRRVEPTLRAYVGQRTLRAKPVGDRYVGDVLEHLSAFSP